VNQKIEIKKNRPQRGQMFIEKIFV
jgi:hypothetical protein